MAKTNSRAAGRARRKMSIRKSVHGTQDRPRLSVFRSNKNIYAQIIDDVTGKTLASASTLSAEVTMEDGNMGNRSAATKVGELLAEKAKAAGVEKVAFDRNGYLYHGRVKALADGAREGGLKF
jgi:large subunit ribosomal protein L18